MSFGRLGLDELVPSRYALNREPLVATHLSFPSVWHVAVAGDVFR